MSLAAPSPRSRESLLSDAASAPVRARSNLELAARRFARHRLAMAGLIITLTLIALGVLAPLIAPFDYSHSNLMAAN